jgi:SSS family solute:Na+ symporter
MIDQIIVLAYLAIVLVIGLRAGKNIGSLEDYAIGKRNFSNSVLAAGIAATMIAASGTSGLTGKIYSVGLISILSYLGVVASRLLTAFVIAPKMSKFLGLISTGDIFERLYGKEAKILVGFLTLIEGFLHAAAQILATYQACQLFFGISKETAAVVTTVVTIAYCFRGGIRSVTATDVFQFIITIVAIPVIATVCINKIGGASEFVRLLNQKQLLADSVINGDHFKHIIIFISLSITCSFPLVNQRMLMAKNVSQIKKTFFINSLITLFFYVALGIVGLSAAILLPDIDPNFALPALINEALPSALRGLVIAGLMAIFMSSSDSDMNIAAVALTQDLLKPILGNKLNDKTALIFTRISLVITGLLALVVSLYYSNALDILFLLMAISNSVYFPGVFFGIIGLKPSKRGFWLGAATGAITVAFMCFYLGIFPLYAMMTAILFNAAIVLGSLFFVRIKKGHLLKEPAALLMSIFSKRETFFEFKKSNYLVSASSYTDIFAIMVLFNTLAPFFLTIFYEYWHPNIIIILNISSAVLAILLLLRQIIDQSQKLIPLIWHLTIFLTLTLSSAINLSQSNFSLITIFDTATVLALLILLVEKKQLIAHIVFLPLLTVGINVNNIGSDRFANDLYYWSMFLHTAALFVCLVLFRHREVAAYKFMSLKFVHEAGRTISSVSTSASLLEKWLPKLIDSYRIQQSQTLQDSDNTQLNRIMDIPKKLTDTSVRTWENLNRMIEWMETNKTQKNHSLHSINTCIQSAINDNSLTREVREKIDITDIDDFLFLGDDMQISNVILNILENAGHAIKTKPDAAITIWTDKNSLFIKDSGIGITKAILPNIFEDLFSTKGTSGQGLAFCNLMMQQHNGSITCESEVDKYTMFRLDFPSITHSKENPL